MTIEDRVRFQIGDLVIANMALQLKVDALQAEVKKLSEPQKRGDVLPFSPTAQKEDSGC